jgi:hypothetical protein
MHNTLKKSFFNFDELCGPAIRAIKQHYLPILLIQISAIIFVISYYHSPHIQAFCEQISKWKTEGGYIFSIWTIIVAGIAIPELAKILTGKPSRINKAWVHDTVFNAFFFGFLGFVGDAFYRFQSFTVGEGHDLKTLCTKVFIDQFIWNPFIINPIITSIFLIRENHYNIIRGICSFGWRTYRTRIIPILGPVWIYWIPTVSCIYAMPASLQFPLFLCAFSAWSMLLIFIMKDTCNKNINPASET